MEILLQFVEQILVHLGDSRRWMCVDLAIGMKGSVH
jgi:hypothetical protein